MGFFKYKFAPHNYDYRYWGNSSFNRDVNIPNTVRTSRHTFQNDTAFNANVRFSDNTTDASYMFYGCTAFNQNFNNVMINGLANTVYMFYGSKVTYPHDFNISIDNVGNMSHMFENALFTFPPEFFTSQGYKYIYNYRYNYYPYNLVSTYNKIGTGISLYGSYAIYYNLNFTNGTATTWTNSDYARVMPTFIIDNADDITDMFHNCSIESIKEATKNYNGNNTLPYGWLGLVAPRIIITNYRGNSINNFYRNCTLGSGFGFNSIDSNSWNNIIYAENAFADYNIQNMNRSSGTINISDRLYLDNGVFEYWHNSTKNATNFQNMFRNACFNDSSSAFQSITIYGNQDGLNCDNMFRNCNDFNLTSCFIQSYDCTNMFADSQDLAKAAAVNSKICVNMFANLSLLYASGVFNVYFYNSVINCAYACRNIGRYYGSGNEVTYKYIFFNNGISNLKNCYHLCERGTSNYSQVFVYFYCNYEEISSDLNVVGMFYGQTSRNYRKAILFYDINYYKMINNNDFNNMFLGNVASNSLTGASIKWNFYNDSFNKYYYNNYYNIYIRLYGSLPS